MHHRLRGHFRGLENRGGLASGDRGESPWRSRRPRRTGCRGNRCAATRCKRDCFGKRRELWSQHDFAVAAQRHAFGRAFLEFVVIRLPPETGLLGGGGRGAQARIAARMNATRNAEGSAAAKWRARRTVIRKENLRIRNLRMTPLGRLWDRAALARADPVPKIVAEARRERRFTSP